MNFSAINQAIKTLGELINHLASVALKLIVIGAVIVLGQWIENY